MKNFCPGCGTKLNSSFNYCPSCGIQLTDEKFQVNITEVETEIVKVIVCDNCGEENSESSLLCESCGIKLEGKILDKKETQTKIHQQKTVAKSVKSDSEKRTKHIPPNKQAAAEEKTLDQNKLLLYISAVIIGITFILFLAGVFDSGTTTTGNQTNVQNESSGVNLSNINRINELQAKADSDPNDLVTLLELSHLQNDSGLFEKAIINYKRYLEKKPEDADARIDMGVCYYNLRDYDNALAEMTKALSYKPDHQIGHLNLGIVNLSAGNVDKSKEWLLKAVSLNPNSEVGKRAQELLQSH